MSRPQNPLSDALRGFGHTKVAARIVAYDLLSKEPNFLQHLLTACRVAETEIAATWLLKYHIETTDLHLGPALQRDFYDSVLQVSHWEAKLHALQIMDRVPLPETYLKPVTALVTASAKADRKLLRAWGFYGLAQVASQYPDQRQTALCVLRDAKAEGATGAVAVRLRKANELLE